MTSDFERAVAQQLVNQFHNHRVMSAAFAVPEKYQKVSFIRRIWLIITMQERPLTQEYIDWLEEGPVSRVGFKRPIDYKTDIGG